VAERPLFVVLCAAIAGIPPLTTDRHILNVAAEGGAPVHAVEPASAAVQIEMTSACFVV